ncbi:MAG: type II toxin-antitoxin system HipA family toxin [Aestuariibacter sp.]
MMTIETVKAINVSLDFGNKPIAVGRLAVRERTVYFEFDRSFIDLNLEISPIRLPLQPGLQRFDRTLFEGFPGVFNDSLPDGWGRLLFDRFARTQGILPADLTPLDRLAHIGTRGLGALIYEPDFGLTQQSESINLDELSAEAQAVLDGESSEVLKNLIALNGSSAGARPKALIGVNEKRDHIIHGVSTLPDGYEPWIVKFANTQDGIDAGAIEYVYALLAKDAGIEMPDVHLFPAEKGPGYFAIKRFDHVGSKRYHMHTACGLLHSDFRTPSLDYEDPLTLTGVLTRDIREVEKTFRLAAFNVLAHNRDDHSKNISFLMDEDGHWQLSPAYDLTFSSGPVGEQSTTVMGEGKSPGIDHLLKLAKESNIKKPKTQEIFKEVQSSLQNWTALAKNLGVSNANIELIGAKIKPS